MMKNLHLGAANVAKKEPVFANCHDFSTPVLIARIGKRVPTSRLWGYVREMSGKGPAKIRG